MWSFESSENRTTAFLLELINQLIVILRALLGPFSRPTTDIAGMAVLEINGRSTPTTTSRAPDSRS